MVIQRLILLLAIFLAASLWSGTALAQEGQKLKEEEIIKERMALYLKYEALTLVPWYYLAAIDQFERNVARVRPDIPQRDSLISIYIPPEEWRGPFNPDHEDTDLDTISFFGGLGLDGDGDGQADPNDGEDTLYVLAHYLARYGPKREDFRIALWDYYRREKSVEIIVTIADLFRHFNRIDLEEKRFPLPLYADYTYRSTWGDRRGWGGRRIHEGTDIFAGYGTPVRSTTYGKVEIMGWNKYGGWRVGIRDIYNNYHYYAHLSGFNREVKEGDLVEPGTIIGYVGSSGYGPPGTSGKFPPHLHYGIYKDNGRTEWSFDPYPFLRHIELKERKRKK